MKDTLPILATPGARTMGDRFTAFRILEYSNGHFAVDELFDGETRTTFDSKAAAMLAAKNFADGLYRENAQRRLAGM